MAEGGNVGSACAAEPFSAERFAAIRAHPAFREAVETLARGNLANYGGWSVAERWLTSDLGRASLTGAVMALDGLQGGFTSGQLVHAALANRTCSEGRVRHYLRRAEANGFLETDPDQTHRPSVRMHAVLGRGTRTILAAAARLDPDVEAATAAAEDLAFRRRFAMWLGLNTVARPDLFAGPERPVTLFLARDGGARMLELLIARQRPARPRLLEGLEISQSQLARVAFVSRTHVSRLLDAGEAQGLTRRTGRRIEIDPALCDDVERHYALVLEMARVSALAALADPR